MGTCASVGPSGPEELTRSNSFSHRAARASSLKAFQSLRTIEVPSPRAAPSKGVTEGPVRSPGSARTPRKVRLEEAPVQEDARELWSRERVPVEEMVELPVLPSVLALHVEEGFFLPVFDGSQEIHVFARQVAPTEGQEPREALLMCHDLLCSSFGYRKALLALQETDPLVQAVAFDWPGSGLSEKPVAAPMDVPYLTELLHDVADALGWESFHLFAEGTSALVAMQFAVQYPERVQSLIVSNPVTIVEEDLNSCPKYLLPLQTPSVAELTFWRWTSPALARLPGVQVCRRLAGPMAEEASLRAHAFLWNFQLENGCSAEEVARRARAPFLCLTRSLRGLQQSCSDEHLASLSAQWKATKSCAHPARRTKRPALLLLQTVVVPPPPPPAATIRRNRAKKAVAAVSGTQRFLRWFRPSAGSHTLEVEEQRQAAEEGEGKEEEIGEEDAWVGELAPQEAMRLVAQHLAKLRT